MASNWGDDIDEELQRDNRIKIGPTFNYMHMGKLIRQLEDETREWDNKYPKSELLKIWGCSMFMLLILFTFSYSILIVATGLFFFFYSHIILQVYRAWKRFNYPRLQYWLMTFGVLIVIILVSWFLRSRIFG